PLRLHVHRLGGEPDDPGGAGALPGRLRGAVGRHGRGVDAREPAARRDRHRAATVPGPGARRWRGEGVSYFAEGPSMTDFWLDIVLTAIRNMTVTLGAVLPSILAILTLVARGALVGWIRWPVVSGLGQRL